MLKLEHLAWNLPDGGEIIRDIDLTLPESRRLRPAGFCSKDRISRRWI